MLEFAMCYHIYGLFLSNVQRKINENRDTIISSKEVAGSVYLDPWRAGNCPVYFG
jgi:hypothetical protein